jgi:hypothetical protein
VNVSARISARQICHHFEKIEKVESREEGGRELLVFHKQFD